MFTNLKLLFLKQNKKYKVEADFNSIFKHTVALDSMNVKADNRIFCLQRLKFHLFKGKLTGNGKCLNQLKTTI